MFFQSSRSLFIGIVLIPVASYQLFWGLAYADAANREASIVGTLTGVTCGRGCTYDYAFTVNGFRILDNSSTCKTPLSAQGCKKGGSVLVYYDPQDLSISELEEFAAAGRGKLLFGSSMALCGLTLIGLYFIPDRRKTNKEESGEPTDSESDDESDILHVAPSE